jgi:hypothetical protein
LLFVIFLVSVLVLEGILRHDEAVARKSKRLPTTQGPQDVPGMDAPRPGTSSVLTLAKAIEQHSREARRPIAPESSQAGFSSHISDPAIDSVPENGPGR